MLEELKSRQRPWGRGAVRMSLVLLDDRCVLAGRVARASKSTKFWSFLIEPHEKSYQRPTTSQVCSCMVRAHDFGRGPEWLMSDLVNRMSTCQSRLTSGILKGKSMQAPTCLMFHPDLCGDPLPQTNAIYSLYIKLSF